jgi:hypothetical protein
MYGGHLVVELRLERWLRPTLRAYGALMETAVVQLGVGAARFGLSEAGFELCPIRLPQAAAIGARPCVGFAVGQIEGTGIDVLSAQRASALWLEPSLGAIVDWAVTPLFSIALRGAATAPLRRPTFEFEPSVYVYRPPPVGGDVALEVALRFF